MASTYSSLKIEKIGTGEQSGTWGDTTNINLGTAIEEAITGSADVNFATDADVTITLTNVNTSQTARNLRLNITESSTGIGCVRNLILGSECQIDKLYLINNTGTGAKTIKNTAGTGITVPAGKTMFVFNNGTNVVDATTHLSSLTLGSALPVASGGTGATTQTAYSVLCGGTTSTGAYQSVASVGTLGQVLTSNGAGALPTFQTNGTGTVTSVSWTGGIVSVATSTTTPAFTIAGTSGGIPYFSSGTTWASSGVLAASALVIGGGAGAAPSTTTTGTGVVTALGIAVNSGSGGLVTNTGTATLTNKTLTTPIISSISNTGTLTLPTSTDTLVGRATTDTLTNKRITSRSLAAANTSGAITPNSDLYDQVNYLLTGSSSFSNPSGTPTNGQKLTIRLYAASTQTISSWSSSSGGYRAIGVTLPTSVSSTKTVYVGCIWNSTDSKWDVIAVAEQA